MESLRDKEIKFAVQEHIRALHEVKKLPYIVKRLLLSSLYDSSVVSDTDLDEVLTSVLERKYYLCGDEWTPF